MSVLIKTLKRNQSVHTAVVDRELAYRILAQHVAEKAGVRLDAKGVTFRAWTDSRDTSTGIKYNVNVEIVEDHKSDQSA